VSSPASGSGASRVKIIKKPRAPETIEAEISELEKRIAELSNEMARPEVARDITKLVSINDAYQQAEARLAELIDEWERSETTSTSSKR
jgi:prephenate dehydratase